MPHHVSLFLSRLVAIGLPHLMAKLRHEDYHKRDMLLDAPPISVFVLGAIQIPLLMVELSHKSCYGRGTLLDAPPCRSLVLSSDSDSSFDGRLTSQEQSIKRCVYT